MVALSNEIGRLHAKYDKKTICIPVKEKHLKTHTNQGQPLPQNPRHLLPPM
jgi:hypothetical protein